jgi:hypothetical protein
LKLIEARGVNFSKSAVPRKFEVVANSVPDAAEEGRAAAEEGLAQDRRLALIPGIAPARRDAEHLAEIIGEVAEHRDGIGEDVAIGQRGHPPPGSRTSNTVRASASR